MFRKDTQQALRAMLVLARRDRCLTLADVARDANAPEPVLSKVMQRLARGGLIQGRPGPGGGYLLTQPAAEIKLLDIVSIFEGPRVSDPCLLGNSDCGDECLLHATCRGLITQLMDYLDTTTIADLAERP